MTESEGRALARTTLVLFLAAVVRWGATARREPPLVPADSAASLPGLLQESRAERDEAARRAAPFAAGEKLDPNLASEIELDRLPGVGPASARAIVEARETGGGFARPEDLLRVRGIGAATLDRMLPYLEVPGGGRRLLAAGAGRSPASRARGGPSPPSAAGGTPPSAGASAPSAPGAPLDLNAATSEELQRLPGIGPALAGRVLEAREQGGGFRRVDDLLEVRGIGPVTLERLRPLVTVRPLAP
jgi:competence protein ComEA